MTGRGVSLPIDFRPLKTNRAPAFFCPGRKIGILLPSPPNPSESGEGNLIKRIGDCRGFVRGGVLQGRREGGEEDT